MVWVLQGWRSGENRLVWLSLSCVECWYVAYVDVPIRLARVVADRIDIPIRPIAELSSACVDITIQLARVFSSICYIA
jgi:hypothetical protein